MRALSVALRIANTNRRTFLTLSRQLQSGRRSSIFFRQSAVVAVTTSILVSIGVLRVAVGNHWPPTSSRNGISNGNNPSRVSQPFLISLGEALISSAAIDDDDRVNDCNFYFIKSSTTARWILSSKFALDAAGEFLSYLQQSRSFTPSREQDDDLVAMTSVFIDILSRQSRQSSSDVQSSAQEALVRIDPGLWLTISQIILTASLADRLEKQLVRLNEVARTALGNGFVIEDRLSAPFAVVPEKKTLFSSFSMKTSTNVLTFVLRTILQLMGKRPVVSDHDGALALSLLGCTQQHQLPPEKYHALQATGLAFLSNSTLLAYYAKPQILWSSTTSGALQTIGIQLPDKFQNALEAIDGEGISRITTKSSSAVASSLSALDYHFGAVAVTSFLSTKDSKKASGFAHTTTLDKVILIQCIALAASSCINLANDKAAKSTSSTPSPSFEVPLWFAASSAACAVQNSFITISGDSSPSYLGEAAATAIKLLVERVCIPLLNQDHDMNENLVHSQTLTPTWLFPRLQIWLLYAMSRCRGSGNGGLDSQLLFGQSSGSFDSLSTSRRKKVESMCSLEGVSCSLSLASAALKRSRNCSYTDENIQLIKSALTRPRISQSLTGRYDPDALDVVQSLCSAALTMRRSSHPASVALDNESTIINSSMTADASISRMFSVSTVSDKRNHSVPDVTVNQSTQSSLPLETSNSGFFDKVGNVFVSALAGVGSVVLDPSSSTNTVTTTPPANNVAFLIMDDDLGPGLGTGINMVMSAEEELGDETEYGHTSGSLPMTRVASWTALVKRYAHLLDFSRNVTTPDPQLAQSDSLHLLPTYISLVDASLIKDEPTTFPNQDINSGYRYVRPSFLDLSLAVSREITSIPRPQEAAVFFLSSLLSAAEPKHEEESDLDPLLDLRTSIARCWLLSALYSVSNQKKDDEFTLPKTLRVSIAREFTRWMPREMDIAFSGTCAPSTRLVPRAVYRFASMQAERNAFMKGALPPLFSELYIPSSISNASSAVCIHAGKALSYLTSGLTPPDVSARNDFQREISNSTSELLLNLNIAQPIAALIDGAVKRMQIRHLEIENSPSVNSSKTGFAYRYLSEAVEVDRIYKDNVALARQCVRLLANMSMKIDDVDREKLRNQLLLRGNTRAALTAMLHSHDAKLSSHTWRLVANLGGILRQSDSEKNWKYGDMLFPVYQTDASRLHPSAQGIDIVLVHGLQGVALKTWRSGGKTEVSHQAIALGPIADKSFMNESKVFADSLLHSPPKNLNMHVAVVPEGKDASGSQHGNTSTLTTTTVQNIVTAVKPSSKTWRRLGLWPVTWLARDIENEGADFISESSTGKAKFNVRVLSLTYDAEIWGQDGVRPAVDHNSTAAEASLQLEAAGVGSNGRQVVFLSHSMGGLLTERILLYSPPRSHQSSSTVDNEALLSPLAKATNAVVFLATPHRGAPVAEFAVQQLARMHRVLPATKSLAYPSHHIDVLANDGDEERLLLNKAFKVLVNRKKGDLHVLSLAEGKTSDLAQAADGVLGAIPLGILIVPPNNAACGIGDFHILDDEDHVSISKPKGREHGCYPLVKDTIVKSCSQKL